VVTTWSSPGAVGVTFADPSAEDTTVTFSEPGSYRLRLTASDGELTSFDEVTITVNSIPSAIRSISPVGYFATGQDAAGNWLPVRSIDPAGVYIDPLNSHVMIADSEVTEIVSVWEEVHANVFETTIAGDMLFGEYDASQPVGRQQENLEAAGITKCESDGHFYMVNDDRQRLYRYSFDGSNMVMVDWVNTFPLRAPAGTLDPEGVTCDNAGNLYVAGGHGINILVYRYANGFVLDRVMALGSARFATEPEDVPTDPEGIAWDPASGHLFVMNNDSDEIFEYTTAGEYLGRHSIKAVRPRPKQPQGLAIGPSTRTPGKMSFFVADPRVDNNFDETERDGVIYELEIERP
jgi:DNA-binding beta-propeller fold protein YncE